MNKYILIILKTMIETFSCCAQINNGHEFVDLGLPSGLKWATCNVGAEKPEEYGWYFAWGEVAGHRASGSHMFNWSNYKWFNSKNNSLFKYNFISNLGSKADDKVELILEDDAANANWGGSWRMPTLIEIEELKVNCKWTWFCKNGVNGYKVEGKNQTWIFFPATGFIDNSFLYHAGVNGYCWSSSACSSGKYNAYDLYFSDEYYNTGSSNRCWGQSIRPVTE